MITVPGNTNRSIGHHVWFIKSETLSYVTMPICIRYIVSGNFAQTECDSGLRRKECSDRTNNIQGTIGRNNQVWASEPKGWDHNLAAIVTAPQHRRSVARDTSGPCT